MINFCKQLDGATGLVDQHCAPEAISELRRQSDKVIWLDIRDPNADDLALLREEFDFHPLVLEDLSKSHSRPKLEKYPNYVFLVAYEVRMEPLTGKLKPVEIDIILGPHYVVTVHRGEAKVIAEVGPRWEAFEKQEEGTEGSSFLAYLIIDAAVDSYFPILDGFSDQLELLEEGIFGAFTEGLVQDLFNLKKQTLLMRRLVSPLRDVFLVLLRRDEQIFSPKTFLYFQDVLDHLLRIADSIDNQRDLVGSAVDAYMTTVSNRTNETMKKLTVLSTVLMIPTVVSGIYGMNFHVIPELSWTYGYPYALALMVALSCLSLALFRWRRYI